MMKALEYYGSDKARIDLHIRSNSMERTGSVNNERFKGSVYSDSSYSYKKSSSKKHEKFGLRGSVVVRDIGIDQNISPKSRK
jgi:hypothetical protein